MATILPELLLPSSLPPFLAVEHSHALVDVFANIQWTTGHSSKRRVYTVAPRIVTVALDLAQAAMTDFYYWFEGPAKVGVEYFSCQLANFGPGLLWFKTRFFGAYTATPDFTGERWLVKFQLYVLGDGSIDPPVSTSAGSTRTLVLLGDANLSVAQNFSSTRVLSLAEVTFDFSSTRSLVLASFGVVHEDSLTQEDGFYITQEDGFLITL